MFKVHQFVNLSRFAGERFDLVQAGGGNASVKLDDGTMLIKSSGCSLSEVSSRQGYARVELAKVRDILSHPPLLSITEKRGQEGLASAMLRETLVESEARPSIETFLHALLDTFVLHTHPIAVNAVTCRPDWAEILDQLFPQALLVPYQTPGLALALELKGHVERFLAHHGEPPRIVFLQNHGLIVSEAEAPSVRRTTEAVLAQIEGRLGFDLEYHKLVSRLSEHFDEGEDRPIAYLSLDTGLARLAAELGPDRLAQPFCPDGFVFCGFRPLRLDDLSDPTPIKDYTACYHERPKVILHAGMLFIVADSVRKAKEIEDVFRFHVMTLRLSGPDVVVLEDEELAYLANWEAEKYRQRV